MVSKPIFVFVSGGFHTPGYFAPVASRLRAQDYTVLTPPLAVASDDPSALDPDLDCFDDAKLVHAAVLPHFDEGARAIIADHSYGAIPSTASIAGQTVSERARRGLSGGFCALVRVAGASPSVETPATTNSGTKPITWWRADKTSGLAEIQREEAMEYFCSSLSKEERDANLNHVVRFQTLKSSVSKSGYMEKQMEIPKWWVLTEQDLLFPVSGQESRIKKGGFQHVERLNSDHNPWVSQPEQLSAIILRVAKQIEEAK